MFDQKYKTIDRLKLEAANLKGFYWIFPFVLWVLLPVLALSYAKSGSGESGYYQMKEISQQFISMLAPLWIVLIGRDYYNSRGKELLFLYHDKYDNLLLRTLLLWFWGLLHIGVLMIIFRLIFGFMRFELFGLLAIESLFAGALAYAVMTLTGNTFLPLILPVLYCILFSVVFPASVLSIYESSAGGGGAPQVMKRLIVLGISLILCAAGYFAESRDQAYWKT